VPRTLIVAAGGGGDAIAAVLLAPLFGVVGELTVLSWSWDRLIIDPLPGPRGVDEFVGLREHRPGVHEVLRSSSTRSPGGSSLPRLVRDLGARLFLLDGSGGVVGMAEQVAGVAAQVGADELLLVDVGGDVLAQGGEPGLRSPLADLMTLAACTGTALPARLAVAAPGVDGEIPATSVIERLATFGAVRLRVDDPARAKSISSVFLWHPSEATGVFAAAVCGLRGVVEMRDAGDQVALDEGTASVYVVEAQPVADGSPAAALRGTTTLDEASRVLRELTGVSELDYERTKATALVRELGEVGRMPDLAEVDRAAAVADARGADFLTVRRLAEVVGIRSAAGLVELRTMLSDRRSAQDCAPLPLFRVRRR
jgi:hypothetical protein